MLGPAFDDLRPFARNLDELNALDPRSSPRRRRRCSSDEIRPFVRAAREPRARPAHAPPSATRRPRPPLTTVATKINRLGNMAAYNPNGAEPSGVPGPRRGLPLLGRLARPQRRLGVLGRRRQRLLPPHLLHVGCDQLLEIVESRERRRADPEGDRHRSHRRHPRTPLSIPSEPTMQKQAPSVGRILIAVGLHALVLRADPLPLDRLRRPDPAEARELPDHRLLPRGDPARARVRRADRRGLGRQGEGDRAGAARRARQRQGHDRGRDRDRARVRADLRRTRGRSCARRRCSARPTSSSPRAPSPASRRRRSSLGAAANVSDAESERIESVPEGGTLGVSRTEEATQIDEIFNALDEETRLSFQRWQANAATAIDGRGLDLNDSFGNLGPVPHRRLGDHRPARAPEAGAEGPGPRHRDDVRGADRARPGARRGDRRLATTPSTALASEDQALAQMFQILPTFQRESRLTLERLDQLPGQRAAAGPGPDPGRPRPLADAALGPRAVAAPAQPVRRPRRARAGLADRAAGLQRVPRRARPGARRPRPVPRQPEPGDPLPRVPEGDRHRLPRRPRRGALRLLRAGARRSGAAPRPAPARLPRRGDAWRSGPAACRPTAATPTSSPGC